MADALASGASVRKDVGVQVPPSAPRIVLKSLGFSSFGDAEIVLLLPIGSICPETISYHPETR